MAIAWAFDLRSIDLLGAAANALQPEQKLSGSRSSGHASCPAKLSDARVVAGMTKPAV